MKYNYGAYFFLFKEMDVYNLMGQARRLATTSDNRLAIIVIVYP